MKGVRGSSGYEMAVQHYFRRVFGYESQGIS
jgi:hypothetical protein